ncbi:autotransporter domain-containing protein [Phenylobacterium sp.]|jgi:outer membrane lipase/esterase|uniref:autotransporter domain-containing protein n=1 Tax=Phenylobacterium sp. TaxID=1871053 RepID=UPI002E374DAC|nr:autotransporter domain-containing protein [Phenylobacterium sp.]HEX2562012.1 autotransporter domain-containing protein [Phenylobacterium sp.]
MLKSTSSLMALALAAGLATASQVAAQEAEDPIDRVIVFGDSLADGGFYAAGNPNFPAGAGSFTTNPDPVSPEVMAAQLGLPLDPVYGRGGTNYAIGGARVTAPSGITIPITNQVTNFLASGQTFGPQDLVYIQGGGNDFFAWVAGGGVNNAILTNAATELAGQVQRLEAAGAERIVTMSIQGSGGLQVFNQAFAASLASRGVNALYVDVNRLFAEIVADPAPFGITNTTGLACIGSSLTCTPATYVAPDANETYLRADSAHPAGITQRIQGQAIASLVKAPEQIGQLSFAAQSGMRAHRDMAENAMHGVLASPGNGPTVFGSVGHHDFDSQGSKQLIGLEETSTIFQLGVDYALSGWGAGLALSYSQSAGEFYASSGGYDGESWSATAYARTQLGPIDAVVDASYGQVDYNELTRRLTLGPAVRLHRGQTDGTYMAVRGSASVNVFEAAGFQLGPEAAVTFERIEIDGYDEAGDLSTSATFGEQDLESVFGRIGLVARRPGPVSVFARVSYEHEFDSEDRRFVIRPAGAPISYESRLNPADEGYFSYAASLSGQVSQAFSLQVGVSGYSGRGELDSVTGSVSGALAF